MTLNFIDSVGGLRGLCYQDLRYICNIILGQLYQKMSPWYTWTNLNVCQMLIHSTSPCPYTEQLNKYLRWPRCRWVLETHLTSDIKFVWHLMHLTLFSILFDVSTIIVACEQALHLGDIVKSTRARGTREETRLRSRSPK